MSESALAKKMKLKPRSRAAVVDAPDGYLDELGPVPEGAVLSDRLEGPHDWIQVFVTNKAELDSAAPAAIDALALDGLLWFAFPKGSSRIQTDLTRDQGWESVLAADLKWVGLISVNDIWSAFGMRRYRPGEARRTPPS